MYIKIMTNDNIGKTVLGFGAAAVFGLAACKYIDSLSVETETKEHFTKTKKTVPSKKPQVPRKKVVKKENFGNTKKLSNKEFLTDTSRFGASTRELLNYRDIRPMPLITPAAEGTIPFGGSGLSDVPTNTYSKNIFSLGSGSSSSVPGNAGASELLGGASSLDGTQTSSLYASV